MEVNEIISAAIAKGACGQSSKATDWKSLAWLFFSPQGREFCGEHNYPSHAVFQQIKDNIGPHGIFVDESVSLKNHDVALIGDGESTICFEGTEKPYKVILMHGAKARIHASMYALVKVENISGEYEVFNDGTATVL